MVKINYLDTRSHGILDLISRRLETRSGECRELVP